MAIEPSPQSCLIRAYAALQALDMASAEQQVAAGFQHVLHGWWQLPERPWTGEAHCALLRQMQQLVELRESVRVLVDISAVRDGARARLAPPPRRRVVLCCVVLCCFVLCCVSAAQSFASLSLPRAARSSPLSPDSPHL